MSSIFTSWKAMSLQPLRWFALNGIFANLSNGLTYIIMTWILLGKSNSLGSLAGLMICFWAPTVLLSPLCGAIADRYSRRRLMIISNLLRGVLLIGTALFMPHQLSVSSIYIIALLLSVLGNLYGPASFAFIREIVPSKQMLHANAVVATCYEIGNIVGMGSAGLLAALNSSSLVLAIGGILFLMATLCLTLIKQVKLPEAEIAPQPQIRSSFWQDIRAGSRYLLQKKNVRVLYAVQMLLMINFLTAPILLAPFAKNVLHTSSTEFGLIQSCLSAGIIVGGLAAPLLVEMWNFKRVVLCKTLLITCLFLLFSVTTHLWTAKVIYFLLGVGLASWTLVITRAQLHTDVNFLARVQATFYSIVAVIILIIYLLLNAAGNMTPLTWLYRMEAALTGIAVLLLWRHRKIL